MEPVRVCTVEVPARIILSATITNSIFSPFVSFLLPCSPEIHLQLFLNGRSRLRFSVVLSDEIEPPEDEEDEDSFFRCTQDLEDNDKAFVIGRYARDHRPTYLYE